MPNDYHVEVRDSAGLFTYARAVDWTECLALVRELARMYPHKTVSAYNAATCEVDTDGLTDRERDELVVAVDESTQS